MKVAHSPTSRTFAAADGAGRSALSRSRAYGVNFTVMTSPSRMT
jgi:hypothetical protein